MSVLHISRSTMGAPHRRTIYTASLEAHIDRLHNHLLGFGLYPVPFSRLEPYRGLNSKTAKVRQLCSMFITIFPLELVIQSMVSGLQHDATQSKLKLLELDRSVCGLSLTACPVLTPFSRMRSCASCWADTAQMMHTTPRLPSHSRQMFEDTRWTCLGGAWARTLTSTTSHIICDLPRKKDPGT